PGDKLTSGRKIAADEIAAYFHTGGTTGTPKLVRHTHLNQVSQAWVVNLMLKSMPGGCVLFGLPLFHVGGALTQGLTTFAGGGAVVVLSPSGWRNPNSVKNVWKLIERFKPKVFGAVPTIVAAALNVPVGNADISSLEVSSAGASTVPVPVGKQWEELTKTRMQEVYGMTETSGVHTISYADRPIHLGAVGHSVPFARTRIVKIDHDGKFLGDCKLNEIGVVAMAGPGVFSGYLNDRHNKEAFVEPGWVNSGDLGRIDENGYLWITGRAKDIIIRGGHNIDPMPIEEILFQHPAVGLAAVVGQPDAHAGELPVAYVQLKPDVKADPGELIEFVRARTPERAAVPVNLFPISPMPLTAVGKVFKPDLRWDAARRVFSNALATLANQGIGVDVHVGAHSTHGTLATITLKGVPDATRASLEKEVHERLNPFTVRHEVRWG
ncbi:MAG TPA: AMP-binding protein, partial [bacterium]